MASGIGFFVGLAFAGIVLVASLIAAYGSPYLGAIGYATTIYVIFVIMAGSSWSIRVKKNAAWARLDQLGLVDKVAHP